MNLRRSLRPLLRDVKHDALARVIRAGNRHRGDITREGPALNCAFVGGGGSI